MKALITLLIVCLCFSAFAQTDSGLVAHWCMSTNGDDSSGNGHDGTMYNVTSTDGMDGIPGTALLFHGPNSCITVPTALDLDLTEFTICATVKPQGLSTALCQDEVILWRGTNFVDGHYGLFLFDGPYDDDCNNSDTTKFVFGNECGSNMPLINQWQYSPNISSDTWYKVVSTYKDGVYKIFVNGELKSTVYEPSPVPIGSSTDSLVIGRSYELLTLYPYQFEGAIDDIKLYNRELSDSEAIAYKPTGGSLSSNSLYNDNRIRISPNPATDVLNVYLVDKFTGSRDFVIVNQMGETVSHISATAQLVSVDLSKFASGIYFLQVREGDQSFTRKFVKQ